MNAVTFFQLNGLKTKVDKFYLFFDPWFSLFKIKRGDTEYGIGWLPLGGYVKIAGMIDESMDKEQMEGPVQPWEFRAKPAWQRLIIMLGGVTVNFVLGFFLLAMIFWIWGNQYIPNNQVTEGIYVDSIGYDMGLRDGDKILKFGENDFERFNPGILIKEVVINQANQIEVERQGRRVSIPIDSKYSALLAGPTGKENYIFERRRIATVDTLVPNTTLVNIGVKKGDQILSLNNISTKYVHEFERELNKVKGSKATISLVRNGLDTMNLTVAIPTKEKYKPGVGWYSNITQAVETFGFMESFPKGYRAGINFLGSQITAFKLMGQGKIKAKDSLGSVISIGKLFGPTWDWRNFWWMTAILSLILAVMNLLPIPALDGGHVVFLLFEWITGIKPSDKFMEYATTAGFFILMALMIYVLGLDISRLF